MYICTCICRRCQNPRAASWNFCVTKVIIENFPHTCTDTEREREREREKHTRVCGFHRMRPLNVCKEKRERDTRIFMCAYTCMHTGIHVWHMYVCKYTCTWIRHIDTRQSAWRFKHTLQIILIRNIHTYMCVFLIAYIKHLYASTHIHHNICTCLSCQTHTFKQSYTSTHTRNMT
jgi:hypothetical protein